MNVPAFCLLATIVLLGQDELRKAQEKLAQGDFEGVITETTRLIDSGTPSPEVFLLRGEARKARKDFQGAVTDASAALRKDPNSVRGYVLRASAHFALRDNYSSARDCEQAHKLDPRNLQACLIRAQALAAREDFKEAAEWYSKTIDLGPPDAELHAARASARFRSGEFAGAREDCDRALGLQPAHPRALFYRAFGLLAAGKWNEAKAAFEQGARSAPGEWDLRADTNVLLEVLPELESMAPTLSPAARLLAKGRALLRTGELDRSILLLEQASLLDPPSLEPHEELAKAYHRRSDSKRGDGRSAMIHLLAIAGEGKALSWELQRIMNARTSVVQAGLLWLARHQMPAGNWNSETLWDACRMDGSPACPDRGESASDLRCTALAILTFLGAGYSQLSKENYGTRPIAHTIRGGLQWMLARQNDDGSLGKPGPEPSIESQAIATLSLSEAYGMTAAQALKEPAQKSVDYLISRRLPGKGWPARPGSDTADVMATGWALVALKSAAMSELSFPPQAAAEGADWLVAQVTKADPAKNSLITTVASAIVHHTIRKDHRKAVQPFIENLFKIPLPADPRQQSATETFFVTLALRTADPGERWHPWVARSRPAVVKRCRFDAAGNACVSGSWDPVSDADRRQGRLLTTLLSLLALEIQYGYANCLTGSPD